MGDFSCTGNLGTDPELTYTPSGQALVKLRVAETKRTLNKQTQEWEDGNTSWWSVTVWGPYGEAVAENLTKGQTVNIKGDIEIKEVEKDGEKRYYTEVTARKVGLDVGRMKPKGESSSFGGDSRPPF